ncbi:uncharacterized protein F5147DRAFT_153417 [Suillus discolor]|uniref:Ricin B lectin domain-containing protein n=1 Tax=Suillus discolor TaxID=1912936 RepID=A0A9P7F702_9AGAM|nr:uncharacterized protein F5147DRAFT_153417 [Suillus discolor]KAG2109264.1 hypothetical protein F5147DRAFT_153417 [Suillus discolor]
MPFSIDGVYTIENVGRDLMLDLKGGDTIEGNQIQGYANNNTAAQQWVIKKQYASESSNKTVTIQSIINGNNGNGFFAAVNQDADEPVVYTRQAFIVDLVPHADNTYTIRYTLGDANLVLSIPARHTEVTLETYSPGSLRQQWQLHRVSNLQ